MFIPNMNETFLEKIKLIAKKWFRNSVEFWGGVFKMSIRL